MFPYIGIMADEEPKDSISPSGLYNTSLVNGNKEFSSPLLSGDSEFTIMFWVYRSALSSDDIYESETDIIEGSPVTYVNIRSNTPTITLISSNSTTMTCSSPSSIASDEWSHIAFTGSVSENRLKVYVNGLFENQVVMSYSLATSTQGFLIGDGFGANIAQLNKYNRKLSDAEVLEHYVYDDDLLFAGVLGYDAMTASQRDGLFYSSSYIDTISIAGNEFTDKSGNGVTLSPQPTLTGQQIYVYTDVNDLPNGGDVPVIYPVNSINWTVATGTGNRYQKTPIAPASTSFAVSAWVKLEALGSYGNYYLTNHSTSAVCFSLYHEGANDKLHVYNGSNFAIAPTASVANEWFHIVGDFVGGSYLRLYINGVQVSENTTSIISSLPSGGTETCGIGYNPTGTNFHRGSMFQIIEFKNHGGLSQAEVDELYELKCFNNYSTPMYDKMSSGYNLGNYNGNTGSEATDQIGSDDLIAGGAMIFDETGLSVECGGTPTAPSNALPSNLPTIL